MQLCSNALMDRSSLCGPLSNPFPSHCFFLFLVCSLPLHPFVLGTCDSCTLAPFLFQVPKAKGCSTQPLIRLVLGCYLLNPPYRFANPNPTYRFFFKMRRIEHPTYRFVFPKGWVGEARGVRVLDEMLA